MFFSRLIRRIARVVRRFAENIETRADVAIELAGYGRGNPLGVKELIVESTKYDMITAESEEYYAEQYWSQLQDFLLDGEAVSSILDLGCGQGRLASRFSRKYPNAMVSGFDISPGAIETARRLSAVDGLENLVYGIGDIADIILERPTESIDIVVMTEVAFYHPEWVNQIEQIALLLRKGGIFIGSFRSTYFNTLLMLQSKRVEDAHRIVKSTSGQLSASQPIVYSWNNSSEVHETLEASGLEVLSVSGIGTCSGIPGDPHSTFARPGQLKPRDRELLMDIEQALGSVVPDAGRYMSFVARKKV